MEKRIKVYLWMAIGIIIYMAYVLAGNMLTVHAETYGDFTYSLINDDTEIMITGYTGSGGELTIPSEIDGKIVTIIGSYAFSGCSELTGDLVIPSGVTSIGYEAFYGCSGFDGNLVISESVASIGESTFSGCSGLTGKLVIPEGVATIGNRAFDNCSGLTEFVVSEENQTYKSIDGILYNYAGTQILYVLQGKIGELTIPEGVTSVNGEAFWGCHNITRVMISSSVMSLGGNVPFSGCSALTDIVVAEENAKYQSIEGVLYNQTGTELLCVPEGKSGKIIVPSGTVKIGEMAFWNCSKLSNVVIPASVTEIGNGAFGQCYNLSSVTMSEGVIKIGKRAFHVCKSLKSITIPNGVTEIGEWAFNDCINLSSIDIPQSVTKIGTAAFYGCESLSSVNIPDGLTSLEQCVFEGCSSLTSIEIPASVTSIVDGAFDKDITLIVSFGSYAEIYAKEDSIPYIYSGDCWTVTIKNSKGRVVKTLCVDKGGILSAPQPSEERTNEIFLGFFNGDTKFDFSKPITGNVILTEKWEEKKDNPEIPVTPPQETGITLNTKNLSFDTIGTTQTLTATVTPDTAEDKTITWISSNEKVATVSDGIVTSVGNGTATITAKTVDGKTATVTVTVSQKTTKLAIQLNGQNVSGTLKAKVKKSYSFKTVVTPENADAKNAIVTWTSSNKKVATVSSKGKVTVKKNGKVTITAKTADGSIATVKLNAGKKAVKVSKLTITGKKTMKVKAKQTLKVKVAPATADNRKVTWKSSNKKVATVNSKGVVTAKKKGKVTITATAKDGSRKKATIKITVNK